MPAPRPSASAIKTRKYIFLLLDQFSLVPFSTALDTLRIANRFDKKLRYDWTIVSTDGAPVACSNGTKIVVDMGLEDITREDTVMICGGLEIDQNSTKRVMNWLRREARKGVSIGGLCTGAHTMAKAGLLDGKKCTIHWENYDSFTEEFEDVQLSKSVYVIDGNRFTSAGGTSSLDLMLKLMATRDGEEIANWVADQCLHTNIRTERDEQRLSIPTRIGVRHPKLSTVIQMMESNIEEPVSPSVLAQDVGMSTRQLERLFSRYLNRSPKRYYMELRLQKARNLLMQTEMSVINVALACGFASPSHFSKCYRAQYDTTPYRERGSQASRNPGASLND
ncbi:GlxA family transcriptional regulator [Roseobacter sp. N2S]|uniref:GlxA family transcriptional regulator n=1 Tax=Roseobacter sp. N2S TaxID=2663844 RepID=UPI0028541E4F|nr:GlxA family transcriptional regulator [Roseobacter sp. N2S]MDR6263911.1 transcriptional regulator GlxA family with amidase domain [Roseobacter sp. N2S]